MDSGNNLGTSGNNHFQNTMGESIPNEKQSFFKNKRNIVILISCFLFAAAAVIGGIYYSKYSSARKDYENAEKQVTDEQYSKAYISFTEIKKNGSIKKFRTLADEQIQKLYQTSKDKYISGANTFSGDTNDYSKTKVYYQTYCTNFDFDTTNIENAKKIISGIDTYTAADKKFKDVDKYTELVKANRKIVNRLNKYIDEADELYEMANSAVNKKNTSEMLRLIREWGRNRDYYYDVYDDIDSLTDKNVKYTFFTKTQYSNLKLYVLSCMLPAETIYNMFYEKKLSNKETRNIRNNWSRRENLESGVKKSVSDADDIIEFYDANHAKLAKDANTYHQNLKDLFIGMTPSEGGAAGGGNNESKEGTVNL